ncbi:MFS transporter [Streptomyces parvulus]|uniref:MFS transporter n=1 Tax=Streptomyces parvulus TaxID=146923 RepID=UPI0037924EA1
MSTYPHLRVRTSTAPRATHGSREYLTSPTRKRSHVPQRDSARTPTDAPLTRHEGKSPSGDALIIGILLVSAFTVMLNEMLLGVALPTLIVDLDITPSTGQWLTTGYLLTLAILIPATGFLLRRFNLRTIFISSLSLFTVGTAIAAVAPGFGVLFTGRIIQAAGTAALMPLLMATTMRLVPPHRRGRTMAMVTGVTAVAPAVGPAVSGVVISQLSWRWLFILVLPVVLTALALGVIKLRNITRPEPVKLDMMSLTVSAIGFGALVYGVSTIGESVSGHTPVPPYFPIAIGLLALTLFVRRQTVLQRKDNAFLDMRIFRTRAFTVPLLVMLIVALIGFGTMMVLPLILTNVAGLTTFQIGLFLVPGGALMALVSALGGRIYDRYGPRPLAIPGSVIWTGSLWFLSRVDETTSVTALLAAYLILSASQALMATRLRPWDRCCTGVCEALPGKLPGPADARQYSPATAQLLRHQSQTVPGPRLPEPCPRPPPGRPGLGHRHTRDHSRTVAPTRGT